MKTFALVVLGGIALILVGSLVVSLLGTLLKLALYLVVGGVVVGGAYYLWGRAKKSINGEQRRQLP